MPRSKSVFAIPVKAVTGVRSQDGRHGVLLLITDEPGPNGRERLNLSVKTDLLPALAAVCLGLIDPRRNGQGGRRSRALTATRQIEIGIANNGQVALTFQLEVSASISFGLDSGQARSLAEALEEFAEQAAGSLEQQTAKAA